MTTDSAVVTTETIVIQRSEYEGLKLIEAAARNLRQWVEQGNSPHTGLAMLWWALDDY